MNVIHGTSEKTHHYWWLVRVTLVGCFWLFYPKILGGGGAYELAFYSKRNAALVVLTMLGGGNTQTLLDGKKNELMHSQVVEMQKLSDFP